MKIVLVLLVVSLLTSCMGQQANNTRGKLPLPTSVEEISPPNIIATDPIILVGSVRKIEENGKILPAFLWEGKYYLIIGKKEGELLFLVDSFPPTLVVSVEGYVHTSLVGEYPRIDVISYTILYW